MWKSTRWGEMRRVISSLTSIVRLPGGPRDRSRHRFFRITNSQEMSTVAKQTTLKNILTSKTHQFSSAKNMTTLAWSSTSWETLKSTRISNSRSTRTATWVLLVSRYRHSRFWPQSACSSCPRFEQEPSKPVTQSTDKLFYLLVLWKQRHTIVRAAW